MEADQDRTLPLKGSGFNHGWLMAVDGVSSKILAMTPMNKPEHNKAVAEMMTNIFCQVHESEDAGL